MIKAKVLILCSLVAVLWGCSHPLKSNFTEDYSKHAPLKIALLPLSFSDKALEAIRGDAKDDAKIAQVRQVFDESVRAKLIYMGYVLPATEVVSVIEVNSLDKEGIEAIVKRSSADGLMVLNITRWKARPGVLRTYIKIAVEGRLYSKKAVLLWEGSYNVKESAVSLDKSSRQLSVIEAFEPTLERTIDALFVKFPNAPALKNSKESDLNDEKLFDWLR